MNKQILEVVSAVSMEKGVDKEIIFEASNIISLSTPFSIETADTTSKICLFIFSFPVGNLNPTYIFQYC